MDSSISTAAAERSKDDATGEAQCSSGRESLLRYSRVVLIIGLVLLPLLVPALYVRLTGLPSRFRIATGPVGGRYRQLSQAFGHELASRLGLTLELIHTDGSQQNLQLLRRGEADFGLYQQSTWESAGTGEMGGVSFVANLYEEPLHLIVRTAAGIDEELGDLEGRRVNLGPRASGDYGVSRMVLQHLGIDEGRIDACYLSPAQSKDALVEGSVDAAFVTMAVSTPVLAELFSEGACELRDLPYRQALTRSHFFLTPYVIPAGTYRSRPSPVPDRDILTVSTNAQLLARSGAPTALVEEATKLVHDQSFQKINRLRELFVEGTAFSRRTPEFPIHQGARNFYEPELRPLLSPEFVESTEGIRSFLVSLGVAGFFLFRWLKRRRMQREGHQLDRYIHALLNIEQRQMGLDSDGLAADVDALQELLDEVTELRQQAMSSFTAHQLGEDRGVECFVQMCHALSDKINAKLSRQRLDQAVQQLRSSAG